jgi:hypothetical protein
VEFAERAAQDIGDLADGARRSGTVDDRCSQVSITRSSLA